MRTVLLILVLLLGSCGRQPVVVHPADTPPARLSEWGVVVERNGYLELDGDAVPYELNVPLFSDYALKLRTLWMPPGTAATYRDAGPFAFPVGTIISKTFYYEKAANFDEANMRVLRQDRDARVDGRLDLETHRLIETRLLVHYEGGWKALPYVWNDAQDEAYLEPAGDVQQLTHVTAHGSESFVYVVPDVNQCAGCHVTNHASKRLQPIGLRAWQLNRPYADAQDGATQLDEWIHSGRLSGAPEHPPTGPRWGDAAASTTALARAYLDVNCAHCHNEAGAADTSALDLSQSRPLDRRYGICKPPVAVGRGSGDRPYDIYPGRPDQSILLYRMQHSDPAIAMPELGRGTMHAEAVAVIGKWISELDGDC